MTFLREPGFRTLRVARTERRRRRFASTPHIPDFSNGFHVFYTFTSKTLRVPVECSPKRERAGKTGYETRFGEPKPLSAVKEILIEKRRDSIPRTTYGGGRSEGALIWGGFVFCTD